ncbi:hypothetical protein G436_0706 [Leptospira interrogans serovar Hardjo str. Norma]|uniref:Uncharacterized protein n=1 Tax=Leptospira interrogans serovar Hardjo str. Norma TaxID=1279460 RepID=A0A0M3TKT6_LEPIR|nr:hypothetical protein G436_0706 [Leptospira interrogans serovar Hardjo str. Norma]
MSNLKWFSFSEEILNFEARAFVVFFMCPSSNIASLNH